MLKKIEGQAVKKMVVSYNKLWKKLIDKKMNKTELRARAGIGTTTLAKLSKDQPVSTTALMKICAVLDCDVGDIMEILKTEKTL